MTQILATMTAGLGTALAKKEGMVRTVAMTVTATATATVTVTASVTVTVIATATASGKSLAYHLPVLDALIRDGLDARGLYLYPTKALARDQMADLEKLLAATGRDDLTVAVYDGDTPPPIRQALREHGALVLTNPHMLHQGILPNHQKWQGLFTGLRFVVVDELHTLSGIYGSHVANVLRRLRRLGIHCLDAPPAAISTALLNRYLEIKRRELF